MAGPYRNPVQYTTVASGTTVSSPFDVRGYGNVGFTWPTSVNENIYLQTAHDTTSASFVRLHHEVSSTTPLQWVVTSPAVVGAGAVFMEDLRPFAYARVELGAAATITCSFTIVGKIL